jgi:hypothetical protein
MPIKAVYDKQEDVPEEWRGLFEEKNGKWCIQRIEGLVTQADLERVQGALNNEKKEHATTKTKLQAFGEKTPEEVIAMGEKITELEARVPKPEEQKTLDERVQTLLNQQLAAKTGPLERQIKELTTKAETAIAENTQLKDTITKGKIKDAVVAAATKLKVINEAIEDVQLYAERVFEINADGKIVTRDNVGCIPGLEPENWLGDMKEKRPHWWPTSNGGGAGGGNNPGGGGGNDNPFSYAGWNRTKQGQVDPAKKEQLAKMAGFQSAADAIVLTDLRKHPKAPKAA